MEEAYKLMNKAIEKEPDNDFIKREKLFMSFFDGGQEQEKAIKEYPIIIGSIKDSKIAADIKKFFDTKAKVVEC